MLSKEIGKDFLFYIYTNVKYSILLIRQHLNVTFQYKYIYCW